jgi:GNAT superfamily N-acetyltransferase
VTNWREPVVLTEDAYLAQATVLLQRMRLARPVGGIWEAADVQWWWRQPRATDAAGQFFWLDDSGDPLAAVLLTSFTGSVQCDVLVLPDDPAFAATVWETALRRVRALAPAAEFPVEVDDAVGAAALEAAGYLAGGEPGVVASWLGADARPQIRPLAPGYRLVSRADSPDGPHPMAARNGAAIEARLRTTSLYEPGVDLVVLGPDGSAAGYGLFWADPVTKVGLVEPMRTERAHERRGIASHILAAGLDLLAARGCQRLKVSNDIDLYLRAGFVPLPAASAPIYSLAATP